jgi:hypothetical protein
MDWQSSKNTLQKHRGQHGNVQLSKETRNAFGLWEGQDAKGGVVLMRLPPKRSAGRLQGIVAKAAEDSSRQRAAFESM